MIGKLSNTSATLALLSFCCPINPSSAFTFTPSPLYSNHHHQDTTAGTGVPQQNLPKLFAGSKSAARTRPFAITTTGATANDNEDDVAPSSSSPQTISQSQAVLDEASDALQSVGWSSPMTTGELTSDDPFVRRIEAQIFEESGVGLEELLNPAKVINLERDLYNLRSEYASLTGRPADFEVLDLLTEECDGGIDGGEKADAVLKKIEKKERDLYTERRAVFRGWLKNVFLGQAVLSLGISFIMVTDPGILFGGFDWFSSVNSMDVSIKVLGFWWWWLFIVPSLRSRRPSGFEKKALDIAFLATPAISITAPIVTKDQALIWGANFAIVAGSYAFAYLTYDETNGGREESEQPDWLKFIYRSLDFGSGKERGLKK